MWERAAELMLRLIDRYDNQTVFLWLLIEETGFPLPLPGDMAMLIAGYRVGQGHMHPVWALALLEVATLIGGSALFWLGARGGRPLLYRYGRFVRLDRAKLDRAESWLQSRQFLTIALGRVTPGLRNVTVIAAGVFGVPYRTFLPAFALGSFLYIAFFFGLGMWVGPTAIAALG
jgi:membrane protein DedA with SNARE-associated domain